MGSLQVDLSDRVALVTGSGRGIGAAIIKQMAELGAAVCVNDINPDSAQQTADEIASSGGDAMVGIADVGDYEQAEGLVKQVVEAHGKLDILVNNAGITRDQLIMKMPEDDWDLVMRVNLKSAYNCSKAAIRGMMRKRYGRIINMASVSGILGQVGQTNYSASKAGLIGFTRALAREVASRSITVNAIAPGYIPTELSGQVSDEMLEAILVLIPLGRFGTIEDIANAAVFLASEEAGYITGHVLSVNGGMAMS